MRRLQPLWLATALLTTLPVGRLVRSPVSAVDQGCSVACYPLVGVLVGGILALVAAVLAAVPAPLAAALVLTLWVGLTGGLHLDGLADCVDGWYAGHGEAERSLRVMKDPATGSMAVVTVVLLLLVKFAALLALWPAAGAALAATPVFGRGTATLLMATTPYQRQSGIASEQSAHLSAAAVVTVAAAATVAMLALLPPGLWFAVLLTSLLSTWWWRRLWHGRIGGYTGDVVGALIEGVETAVLVIAGVMTAWR